MWLEVPLYLALALKGPSIDFPIPDEYKKGATTYVQMVDTQAEIDTACGVAPEGMVKLGCLAPGNYLVVGNPCNYPEANDKTSFAYLMCHEKAHTNGWRH
jgi:hypothetical protein